jgi:two-component system, CAI-1 autoinducer sensor kinase/phosphatase CqsS
MYALLPALISGLFLAFGLWVLIAKGFNRVTMSFFLLCMTTFFWQGTWAVLFDTRDPDLALLLIRFGYLLIAFLPTTLYHFLVEISDRQREHRWVWLSYAIAAVFGLMAVGTDRFIDGFHTYFFGFYPKAGDLHPLHVLQTVIVVTRGLYICWRQESISTGAQQQRLKICIVSLLVYFFAAIDYLCNYGLPIYPPGIVFITISLALMTYAITKYDLFSPLTLAASVAHEMRTPLASIRMQTDVIAQHMPELRRGYQLAVDHGLVPAHKASLAPSRIDRVLRNIHHEVNRSNTVIDMMLASSRMEHIDKSNFEWHSMQDCVLEAVETYPFLPQERAQVSISHTGDFNFYGSRHLFVCVLFNLFKNSLYAMKAAGKGEISIHIDARDNAHRLVVSDTASGIPLDVLKRIFDPFYTTKDTAGTGLGLAFCRRVIQSFGGQLRCDSKLGDYTRFTMEFGPDRAQAAGQTMATVPS